MMKTHWMRGLTLALAISVAAVGCAKKEMTPEVEEPVASPAMQDSPELTTAMATAVLAPRAGLTVSGMVEFTESGDSVAITAHLEGAPPGTHGLHIHELGDCSAEDFTSAGGHFNPADVAHGGPGDEVRHAGDLGNIEVGEDGTAHLELSSDLITLGAGDNSIVSRAVILHEKADDLVSQPTGAAGSRLACGVVDPG